MKYFLKCAVNNKAGGGETANGIESGKRADGENEEDKTNQIPINNVKSNKLS